MTKQLCNLPKQTSYPAAHSMDTEWFAVDEKGHIAMFDSGEVGAVPEAQTRLGYQSIKNDLIPFMPANELGYTLMDIDVEPLLKTTRDLSHEYAETGVLLEIVPGYEDELSSFVGDYGFVIHFPRARNFYFVAGDWEKTVLEMSWVLQAKTLEIALVLGLYVYESPENYSASLPYERLLKPKKPLHISQLDEAGQAHLKTVEFLYFYFRDKNLLQPFEHVPSTTHQASWVDSDGKQHDV